MDVIEQAFRTEPLILEWYRWGAVIGFFLALGVLVWIFVDAQRSGEDASLWKSLAAVASVLVIPALLARLHRGFAQEMQASLDLVAYLSIAAVVLAIVSLIAYLTTRGQRGYSTDYSSTEFNTAGGTVEVTGTEPPGVSDTEEGRTTSVASTPMGASAPLGRGKTVILSEEERPRPLALFMIVNGPYSGTTLALRDGVTRIGRDGLTNDHAIDDEAVGAEHLSIRHRDGVFTLTDLDSTNGTKVNGQPTAKCELSPNDEVLIGRTRMVFMQVPGGGTQAEI